MGSPKINVVEHPSAVPSLRHLLLTINPANNLKALRIKSVRRQPECHQGLRRERLSHTQSQLPPLVWLVLEAGAILMMIFSFFFTAASIGLQKIYVSFFVCLLAMSLAILYNLDRPFAASSDIENVPYKGCCWNCQLITPYKEISAFTLLPWPEG